MTGIVEIDSLAYGGSGVGRLKDEDGKGTGKVVFIPFAHPGDTLSVSITSDKKTFDEAEIVEIITPSPERVEPVCDVFTRCGGCSLQHVSYDNQLKWKRQIFEDTVKRIGKLDIPQIEGTFPSETPLGYRSRAAFHVDGAKWGFYAASSNDVVDISSCPLLSDSLNKVFIDIKSRLGGKVKTLTRIEMGVSETDASVSIIFTVSANDGFEWRSALTGVDGLKGFEVRLDPRSIKGNARRGRGGKKERTPPPLVREGSTRLNYRLDDFSLRLSTDISVFTQVNWSGNRTLVKKAVEYAALNGGEHVVDLYSGVGNFALPFAASVGASGTVTAVEGIPLAVKIARGNARSAGLKNIDFIASGVSEWFKNSGAKKIASGRADVVVLDPPRSGAKDSLKAVLKLKPGRIIYISCSPSALSRDLALFASAGFTPVRASVVDLFPQTYHIETLVELVRA